PHNSAAGWQLHPSASARQIVSLVGQLPVQIGAALSSRWQGTVVLVVEVEVEVVAEVDVEVELVVVAPGISFTTGRHRSFGKPTCLFRSVLSWSVRFTIALRCGS